MKKAGMPTRKIKMKLKFKKKILRYKRNKIENKDNKIGKKHERRHNRTIWAKADDLLVERKKKENIRQNN